MFPPVDEWPDNDLIAVGANLEPETLIGAYQRGIFPMIVELPQSVLGWWSPVRRGILPLDSLRVTRSMRQSSRRYDVKVDTCFVEIMKGCADPLRPKGWITDEFVEAYTRLHELGWGHSVEVFDRTGRLAGGLYGVQWCTDHLASLGAVEIDRREYFERLTAALETTGIGALGARSDLLPNVD